MPEPFSRIGILLHADIGPDLAVAPGKGQRTLAFRVVDAQLKVGAHRRHRQTVRPGHDDAARFDGYPVHAVFEPFHWLYTRHPAARAGQDFTGRVLIRSGTGIATEYRCGRNQGC